ncbi:hypothetical protein PTTG_07215 [Puccinia triticina 1-1 BBBD Race 1]|uniref:DUF4219 domain-containing protein n=1 Tax=Puccinia triticina (isolate 1-1 / race 1 (BBBD)) TaxID=630390 RepID=A0A180GX34_PUCT1|nr:hypothetical protein PTTG_07215 [Puccinia triticina 1-1 BBBD Race 1]
MSSTKEELSTLPMLIGNSNYPIWVQRLTTYLGHKDLLNTVNVDPGPNPNQGVTKKLHEAAFIISSKIGDRLYHGIVTLQRASNGYAIWAKVKRMYGLNTIHNRIRATNKWNNLFFNGDLNQFLDHVELSLAEFASIGKVISEIDICGFIIAKISTKLPGLTDPLLTNEALQSDSEALIEKLRDLANHEELSHKPTHSERSATALASNSRVRPPPRCKKVHNSNATHQENKCWALHPHLRPIRDLPATSNNTVAAAVNPAPQSVAYDTPAFANITTAQCLLTKPHQLAPVLDSGASHHMLNDLAFFTETEVVSIAISTGKGSNDLTATRGGLAQIFQSTGMELHSVGPAAAL